MKHKIIELKNSNPMEWKTDEDKIKRTVFFIASLSPHNYWKGYEAIQGLLAEQAEELLGDTLTRLKAINSEMVSKDIKVHKGLIELYIQDFVERLAKLRKEMGK